jgi:PAS domain S-box-containing protein
MAEQRNHKLERELAASRQTIASLRAAAENRPDPGGSPRTIGTLLEALMEATSDHFLAMDLNKRLIFANSAFRKLFQQLYGQQLQAEDDFLGLIAPERGQFWHHIFDSTLSTGSRRFDQQYFTQGTRYDIVWSGHRVVDQTGAAVGVTLLGRDITSQRMAEEALREKEAQLHHAQKMEAVGTLAGGVAHEFNNTLSIILGNLELSAMEIQADHPVRPYIDDAKAGILRAKKVARQLMDFSRRSDGQRQNVEAHTIAINALNLLRASIPSHIEFHQHIETCPPVLADPSHIHQIIINMCSNAAGAMDEQGGVLTVTLEHITLKTGKVPGNLNIAPGRYAKLTVADTGRGMDAHTLSRIYEPFFTTKGQDSGTGLGLAVVQSIIQSYGGTIAAHSKPGRGSKFEVYLPTVTLPEAETTGPPDPAELLGHERILFVDDEPRFVMLTQKQLEQMGYKVEVFTSSVRALERFKEAPDEFDLVISDVAMPKMTGENLVRQIRMLRPDVPVILCTGYSEKVDQLTATLLGCEYLVKPFEIEQLAHLIRQTVDRAPAAP